MNSPRPKRSLGQNFLTDPNYRRKIAEAVQRGCADATVLEIGPGQGAITDLLLPFVKRLVLVEKDYVMAAALTQRFADNPNVHVITGDFLEVDLVALCEQHGGGAPLVAVGNLPYNVSSQILIKLLQNGTRFKRLYLMFQKEVALRCVAAADSDDYSMLSIWTESFAEGEILFDLPPSAFRPQPNVDSSFVRFIMRGRDATADDLQFIAFVKKLFGQRRKKIGTILKGWKSKSVPEEIATLMDARAEALTIRELKKIYVAMNL